MKYKTSIGKIVELTAERKGHIVDKHPELRPYFSKIKKVLLEPTEIRISKLDKHVLLIYGHFDNILGGKYLVTVVKINNRNFIITAHITDKIKAGEKYEKES